MIVKKFIALLMCFLTCISSMMIVNAEETEGPDYYIEIYSKEIGASLTYVTDNETVTDIEGITWDSATCTLTLNGFKKPDYRFTIGNSGEKHDMNLILNGDNEACSMDLRENTIITGDGSLSAGEILISEMEMRSGTLNLNSEYLRNLYITYPTDKGVGSALAPMWLGDTCLYSLSGGTINISGDYNIGIDNYNGSIDLLGTDINIDIPKWGTTGIACGKEDYYGEVVGGKLRIADSKVSIHLSNSSKTALVYCFEFEDVNQNLNYYTGNGKVEKKLTFEEAFDCEKYEKYNTYSRMLRNHANQTYFLITPENLFEDVADSSRYYYEPVYWAFNHEPVQITTGTSKTQFSPDKNVTRGQMVTFLYRLAGEPEVQNGKTFDDVEASKYYAKAISWAASEGITTGYYGTNNFGPDDNCTREQIVTFLWRYAETPAPVKSATFTDAKAGAYYLDALSWAAENGITVGLNDGTGRFGVGHTCTRGMCVTFLYRYASLGQK